MGHARIETFLHRRFCVALLELKRFVKAICRVQRSRATSPQTNEEEMKNLSELKHCHFSTAYTSDVLHADFCAVYGVYKKTFRPS